MNRKKLTLEEEKNLVEEAKSDWKAFEVLYQTYSEEIYYYLLGRFRSKELAEDITSETFLNAMENIKRFEWRGIPFRAWLYRIACNCANQAYKKRKREGIMDPEIAKQIEDVNANQVRRDLDRETAKEKLLVAVRKLKAKDQTLIMLKYFQGMSYTDIAHITGMSTSLVGVKLHRLLKKLKKFL